MVQVAAVELDQIDEDVEKVRGETDVHPQEDKSSCRRERGRRGVKGFNCLSHLLFKGNGVKKSTRLKVCTDSQQEEETEDPYDNLHI